MNKNIEALQKEYKRKKTFRRIIGILIVLTSIAGILYFGIYLMFILGIVQCMEAIKTSWDMNLFTLGLVRLIIGTPVVVFIGRIILNIGYQLLI